MLHAFELIVDVVGKQKLSAQSQQQAQMQEQLSRSQLELGRQESEKARLKHDNKILRKGFSAMLKKQTEWCETKDKLNRSEQENQRLRFALLALQKQSEPQLYRLPNHSDMHGNMHDDVA